MKQPKPLAATQDMQVSQMKLQSSRDGLHQTSPGSGLAPERLPGRDPFFINKFTDYSADMSVLDAPVNEQHPLSGVLSDWFVGNEPDLRKSEFETSQIGESCKQAVVIVTSWQRRRTRQAG